MWNDLRLAFRQIFRRPGTAGVAILSLAIAMSVNTLAFSAVNAFLFKGRAGWDVEGVGRIEVHGVGSGEEGLSTPEFEILADAVSDALVPAAQGRLPLTWQRTGATESVWSLVVSSNYFEILEERPLTGRLFSASDAPDAAAIVSERFWRDQLGGAPLGQLAMTLNGIVTPVIGVLPDSHEGPGGLYAPQLWVRYEARQLWASRADQERRFADENRRWLAMFGRLRSGVSAAEADERLRAGSASIARTWPQTHARRGARFALLSDWVPELQAIARASIAGMTAVGLVLLIACFNVATLLLARAIERDREMSVRAALGASRARLLRQQVTEGVALALLAGVLAAAVATWSQQLLAAFAIPLTVPQRLNVAPDGRVAAFIAVMTVLTGVLPALAPALRPVTHILIAREASGTGGRRAVTRNALVVLQMAGSTAFLAVAVLCVQSLLWTRDVDPGFEDERAVAIALDASGAETAARARLGIERIIDAIGELPGVSAVGAADRLPAYVGFPRLNEIAKGGGSCAAGGCPKVQTYAVGPGFFRAMRVPVLAGREFGAGDAPGVIVNQTLAEQWFGRTAVVGEVLSVGQAAEPRVILAVVRDTMQRGYAERPTPVLYEPLTSASYTQPLMLVAQTSSDPAALVRAIADRIYAVDPTIATESVMTMSARLEMPRWPMRAASLFFGTCGVLALFLATVGLAAVMSHSVTRRMREFGVRVAMGARRGQLLGGVLLDSLRVMGIGLSVGLLAAVLLGRALQAFLLGVDASNPTPYIGVALLQAVVTIAAALVPARRAASADPMTALRAE